MYAISRYDCWWSPVRRKSKYLADDILNLTFVSFGAFRLSSSVRLFCDDRVAQRVTTSYDLHTVLRTHLGILRHMYSRQKERFENLPDNRKVQVKSQFIYTQSPLKNQVPVPIHSPFFLLVFP